MVETFGQTEMDIYAGWCARALALSHARSGNSAMLSGSLGNSDATGATVSTTANAQYDDTFHVAVGAHYRFHPKWRATAGFAYDSSPVGDGNRTVSLPLDRAFRYSAGLIYDVTQRITMGLAYTFIDAGSASVNQTRGPLSGTIQGDYSSNYIHVIGLSAAMRF